MGVIATIIPIRETRREFELQRRKIEAPNNPSDINAFPARIKRSRLSGVALIREIAAGNRYGNGWYVAVGLYQSFGSAKGGEPLKHRPDTEGSP
jgi:hypothetical protein